MEWMCSESFFVSVLPQLKSRIDVFSEAGQWLQPLWAKDVSLSEDTLGALGLEQDVLANVLQFLVWRFESCGSWNRQVIEQEIRWVAKAVGLQLKDVMPLVFVVLSGARQAISAFDLAVLLGPDRTRARVRAGLDVIGGVSKKGAKRLEKSYQEALRSIDTELDAN
jgi:glutamyl-tRNA synthetase